jgi:hypothetical protein
MVAIWLNSWGPIIIFAKFGPIRAYCLPTLVFFGILAAFSSLIAEVSLFYEVVAISVAFLY